MLVRGDHSLNEIKAAKVPGLCDGFRFACAAEIEAHFDCKPGYLGLIGLKPAVKVIGVSSNTVSKPNCFITCAAVLIQSSPKT